MESNGEGQRIHRTSRLANFKRTFYQSLRELNPLKDEWFKSSNNIAEGFEHRSRKEFLQFLAIAKGSCGEVRSMLTLSIDSGIATKQLAEPLIELSEIISKMIYKLMLSLNEPLFSGSAKEPEVVYVTDYSIAGDVAMLKSCLE